MPTPASVRLPLRTANRLGKCSASSGIPQSEIIRVAIFRFLEDNQHPKDVITSVAQYHAAETFGNPQKKRLAR